MGRIVVGVDGSEGSRRAVRWAADEARLRDATLELVYVFEPPYVPERLSSGVYVEELHQNAQADAERALAQVKPEAGDDVRVETVALPGTSPAHALVEFSQEADMLVVGARGVGPFKRLVLGSVSSQLSHHAEVPLVIIRHQD